MKKVTPSPPQDAAILAAVGERGTDPELTVQDFDTLSELIGGTVKGLRLDKQTAVFYDSEAQTATLIDPQNLTGFLILCGLDNTGNPTSLLTCRQVTRYAKLFRSNRTAKVVATDIEQVTLFDDNMEDT